MLTLMLDERVSSKPNIKPKDQQENRHKSGRLGGQLPGDQTWLVARVGMRLVKQNLKNKQEESRTRFGFADDNMPCRE